MKTKNIPHTSILLNHVIEEYDGNWSLLEESLDQAQAVMIKIMPFDIDAGLSQEIANAYHTLQGVKEVVRKLARPIGLNQND